MELNHEIIMASIKRCSELGTDREFQDFVRKRASQFSGKIKCVYAHVRRAYLSGVGSKPEFSGVALTDEEHKLQHQKGERGLLSLIWPDITVHAAKDWFDKEAHRNRILFIKEKENDQKRNQGRSDI